MSVDLISAAVVHHFNIQQINHTMSLHHFMSNIFHKQAFSLLSTILTRLFLSVFSRIIKYDTMKTSRKDCSPLFKQHSLTCRAAVWNNYNHFWFVTRSSNSSFELVLFSHSQALSPAASLTWKSTQWLPDIVYYIMNSHSTNCSPR